MLGAPIPSDIPVLGHDQPTENPHGRPIDVPGSETCLSHQPEEAVVGLPSAERETVEKKLVQGIVNQRRVVGLGLFGGGVHDTVGGPQDNIEEADLGTAAIPGIVLRDDHGPRPTQDQANRPGPVLERQILDDCQPGVPGEVVREGEDPTFAVLTHGLQARGVRLAPLGHSYLRDTHHATAPPLSERGGSAVARADYRIKQA